MPPSRGFEIIRINPQINCITYWFFSKWHNPQNSEYPLSNNINGIEFTRSRFIPINDKCEERHLRSPRIHGLDFSFPSPGDQTEEMEVVPSNLW
jgi:hypothetical protein